MLTSLVGTVLGGRYTIESKIGDGAMGVVYRARHARIPRSFAVKVLHKHLVGNPKLMTRFHREAELAGRLEHKNLVAVVDVGESDGVNYLVMELAEGASLCDLLVETPMTASRVVALVRQLCDGLHYAHELGLIHRDFKPENVIVTHDENGREVPRIVDFGIAILREQAASQEDRLTTAGLVLGTPHYMAPEQAMGAAMDPRVDLFALGVICYELLTGKMPFDGSGVEVARANLLTPTPAMSARVPGIHIDPLLEAFTRKLLEKDKAQRPATARAARDLLDLIAKDRRGAAAALGVILPAIDLVPSPAAEEALRAARRTPAGGSAHRAQPISQPTHVTDKLARVQRGGLAIAGIVAAAVFAGIMIAASRGSKSDANVAPDGGMQIESVSSAIRHGGSEQPSSAPLDPAIAPSEPARPPHRTWMALTDRAPTNAPSTGAGSATSTKVASTDRSSTTKATADRRTPDKVASKPDPAPDPAPPTSRMVADLYVAVGGELKAYSDAHGHDAVADLWSRYRRIILNDVMSTPARRQGVSEMLVQIRGDLANR